MAGVIQKILPREDRFFDLFERQAEILVKSAAALVQLVSGTNIAQALDQIRSLESEADGITRDTLVTVRRSFIIAELSRPARKPNANRRVCTSR